MHGAFILPSIVFLSEDLVVMSNKKPLILTPRPQHGC